MNPSPRITGKKEEKEICICSAIITKNGKIIRGHRHSDCIMAARYRGLQVQKACEGQGFITSKNRYVDRQEGVKLQLDAGIPSVSEGGYAEALFSENLY